MAKKRKVSKSRRSRRKSKPKYRIRNWAEYNASLVQRGSITFWISDDVIGGKPGAGAESAMAPATITWAALCDELG